MSAEIQPADARQRRRWLVALTIVAALGAVGVLALDGYLKQLHDLAASSPQVAAARARDLARALLAAIALSGVLLSLYLGRVSWRTLRDERHPPAGARVLSDTRVLRGRQARRRGQAGLALAALTLLLTAAVVARASRVFSDLLETRLTPTRIDIESHPGRPSTGR